MASVVFLRAVNVGGRTLRPKAIADELGLVNIGAAGTFVGRATPDELRAAVAARLPFATEIAACGAEDVRRLVASLPFGPFEPEEGVKRSVTVLAGAPAALPFWPLDRPEGGPWEVRLLGLHGPFVTSLRRRLGPRLLYPNEVVERVLGVAATTRGWDTILQVADALEAAAL